LLSSLIAPGRNDKRLKLSANRKYALSSADHACSLRLLWLFVLVLCLPVVVVADTDAGDIEHDPAAPKQTERTPDYAHCDRSRDPQGYIDTWYDDTHDYLNQTFCEPVVWFDDFFGSDRVLEEVAGTYVRFQTDLVFDEEQGAEVDPGLDFSVELPNISRRLKLTFESDEDTQLRDIAPGNDPNVTENSIGLRLDMLDTLQQNIKLSVSLKPRIRLRYRYSTPVWGDLVFRYTQEVQREEGINGARTRFDLELPVFSSLFFRSTSDGFVSEEYPGVEWLQAFSLFQRLSPKSSLAYEAGINGFTKPLNVTTNYRLGIRYRRNIHRDWLFFEVAPAMSWPVNLSEDRETILIERRDVASLLFRLEVHFGNAKKKKYSHYVMDQGRPESMGSDYNQPRGSDRLAYQL